MVGGCSQEDGKEDVSQAGPCVTPKLLESWVLHLLGISDRTHMSLALLGEELLKSFIVAGDRQNREPRASGQSEVCGGTTGLE